MEDVQTTIAFSQQREDPLIDMYVCRKVASQINNTSENPIGLKVLIISSAGCTPFSLLTQQCVSQVHAVDFNPAQLQLCKLKQHLIQYAPSLQFQLQFLGCTSDTSPEQRLQMYQQLKEISPKNAELFDWWDSHIDLIKIGPGRAGIYENIFRNLAAHFHSLDLVNSPQDVFKHRELWDKAFADTFDTQKLIEAFGENAVNFSKSQSFADHFNYVFRNAITKFNANQNYFLHSIWKDSYTTPSSLDFNHLTSTFNQIDTDSDGLISLQDISSYISTYLCYSLSPTDLLPLFPSSPLSLYDFSRLFSSPPSFLPPILHELLQDLFPSTLPPYLSNQNELKSKINNIHFFHGNFAEILEKSEKFHIIQMSNITDWMPVQQLQSMLDLCLDHLEEGGAVICRRLNGDYSLEEEISKKFLIDTKLNRMLKQRDRSFFYSEIAIGLKPPSKVAHSQSPYLTPTDLTSLSFSSAISLISSTYNFSLHPYFIWLQSPASSKSQFLETLLPFIYAVEQWSMSISAVIAQIPSVEKRMKIVENLVEEHGHLKLKKSHKYTFLELLNALKKGGKENGGKETEKENGGKDCPVHVLVFNQTCLNYCKTHDQYAGSACLGIIEHLYVTISQIITQGRAKNSYFPGIHYILVIFGRGWVKEGEQHHYEVHAELDIDHAQDLLNIAKEAWEDSKLMRMEIAIGMLIAAQSFWQLYSNMLEELNIEHRELNIDKELNIEQSSIDPFVVGLRLLSSDSSKLELFLQIGKQYLLPNVPSLLSKQLYKTIYEEDSWKIQEHKVTGWVRLLDSNQKQIALGTKESFKHTFMDLIDSKVLWEDSGKFQSFSIQYLTKETEFQEFGPKISCLEKGVKYPLGNDSFEISHGNNYFAFFQRLGQKICYYAVMDNSTICAVICGVLRHLGKGNVWYLCDLKVVPKYRGQRITMYLAIRELPKRYWDCSRGYCISMNPAEGQNRVVKMIQRVKWAPFSIGTQLLLYSLDLEQMKQFEETLMKNRGKISYLSLAGIKDIVLESTGKPMALLHVQFGECATQGQYTSPQEGSTHMFCTPEGDALAKDCESAGLKPTATATVLHHRMSDYDWKFILTSDI